MTDKTQPEALRLALSIDLMDTFTNYQQEELNKAAAELRRLHVENERLSGLCDKWNSECDEFREDNKRLAALVEAQQHTRIAELEAELEAVGAGGVQAFSAAPVEVQSPWSRALEIRMAQGWKLKGDRVPVLYTDSINGEGVGRDDLWLCTTKALAASPTPPAEQQAEESLTKLLAECRDAFPIPEPGSPLEVQWAAAMARPDEVPEYARLCVAAMQAAPKAAPVKACVCGEPQASGTVHRVDGPCYVAAPKAAPGEPDPADIIAGALQISRGHAIEMMREALVAAPQQEAQEPVALLVRKNSWRAGQWEAAPPDSPSYGLAWANQRQYVYAAPQPAPLSDDAVKDAARYRWLRTQDNEDFEFAVVKNPHFDVFESPEELDAAIDAALAAQGDTP